MDRVRDVAVLGAGVAGLTAAYRLKGRDVVVIEAAGHIGGRTLSRRFEDGSWANYAAQYVSPDKVKVIELADELGVALVPSGFHSDELRGNRGTPQERAEIDRWIARLEAEMANPRPPETPELDGISVAAWLGDAPEHVHAFFERWCGQLIFASAIETSLYGLMLLWGDQRTSAFSVEPVPRSNRGDTVFDGGTNSFTHALAQASGAELRRGEKVSAVTRASGHWTVTAQTPQGETTTHARQIVCALPATVARAVIADLPPAKAAALGAIRYGRNVATPIAVLPEGGRGSIVPTAPSRAGAVYNTTKRAVLALTESINMEECTHGIRATSLLPGEVATPILDKRPVPPSKEVRERMVQPEDMGRAILFLAQMPARTCINELVISPTHNRFYTGEL